MPAVSEVTGSNVGKAAAVGVGVAIGTGEDADAEGAGALEDADADPLGSSGNPPSSALSCWHPLTPSATASATAPASP